MFGWEFPPFASGGLGTACHGLTKGLVNQGAEVTFVIPKTSKEIGPTHVNLICADKFGKGIKLKFVDSLLVPYIDSSQYEERYKDLVISPGQNNSDSIYGKDLFAEVFRYSEKAKLIAMNEDFDVIHCHDWMTYKAGIKAKQVSKKPLVVHIHATEFDRTGGNPNQYVYNIEREGFHEADRILAVSEFTRQKVINHYGIHPNKVEVVHNAVEFNEDSFKDEHFEIKKHDKIVLFLGRITLQKGPEYFVYAARMVADHDPNVKFVVAGTGDMERFMIEKATEMGLADKFIFTGFLKGKEIDRIYKMADVYVMPSVSEPFGITPLEAMRNNTPVIISKQSGVSEVINHCLKVDFWDIHRMAEQIISVIKYNELSDSLKENGYFEVNKFNWDEPARKCINAYHSVIGGVV